MYSRIMVPLDGSELAECVFPHVEEICRGEEEKVVYLVTVVEPFQPFVGDYVIDPGESKRIDQENRSAAASYLDKAASRLKGGNITLVKKVLGGRIAEELAEYAKEEDIDLMVIATHGRSGFSRWVWGSIANRILHFSLVPILMIRAPWIDDND